MKMNEKENLQDLIDDVYGSLSTSDKFQIETAITHIKDLEAENAKLKLLPNICPICWTSSFEPTEDGERCLCCWQHECIMDLTEEGKTLNKLLDEQEDNLRECDERFDSV